MNDWLNPPRAKAHPMRTKLAEQMQGAQVTDTFTIAGNKYTLRTLWPYEENWADARVVGVNIYQNGRSRRPAYVAASIVAVNGVSVDEMYQLPDSASKELRETFEKDKAAYDDWRRQQIFLDMTSTTDPVFAPPVVSELWQCYLVLEARRNELLEKIGPLSARTADGASSVTSLLEKAS